jgi:hypothetical protein
LGTAVVPSAAVAAGLAVPLDTGAAGGCAERAPLLRFCAFDTAALPPGVMAELACALRSRGLQAAIPGLVVRSAQVRRVGPRRWAVTKQLGRVLVEAAVDGAEHATQPGPDRATRTALGRAVIARVLEHVRALPGRCGALAGFETPPPLLELPARALPPELDALARAQLLPGEGVLACLLTPGKRPAVLALSGAGALRFVPFGDEALDALGAYARALAGHELAVDMEFREHPAHAEGLRAWPTTEDNHCGGVALLQLLAHDTGLAPLLYHVGAWRACVALHEGQRYVADAPVVALPAVLFALLAQGVTKMVVAPEGDFAQLCRILAQRGRNFVEWVRACDSKLAELRSAGCWYDVAAAAAFAHPCVGASPSLDVMLRHFVGRRHPLKDSAVRRRDWAKPLTAEAAMYAAMDVEAHALCALALRPGAGVVPDCICLLPRTLEAPEAVAKWMPRANAMGEPCKLSGHKWVQLAALGGRALSETVRRAVSAGAIYLLRAQPAPALNVRNYKSVTQSPLRAAMGLLLTEMVTKGIAETQAMALANGTLQPGEVFVHTENKLGSVPKSGEPGFRIVMDCTQSGLNAQVINLDTSLPVVERVLRLLHVGMGLAKFDAIAYFHQILVDIAFRKYQGCRHPVTGELLRLRVLPFGVVHATGVAQHVMVEAMRLMLEECVRVLGCAADFRALDGRWDDVLIADGAVVGGVPFVDDGLVWADPPELLPRVLAIRDRVFRSLGLELKPSADVGWDGSCTKLGWIGFEVATTPEVYLQLPDSKRRKYAATLAEVMAAAEGGRSVQVALLERCAGQMTFAGRATSWARAFSHDMQRLLARARTAEADATVLDAPTVEALANFWVPLLNGVCGAPGWDGRRTQFRLMGPTAAERVVIRVVRMDASAAGYCVQVGDEMVSGAWPDAAWAAEHVGEELEAWAMYAAMLHFALLLCNARVLFLSDNRNLVFCVNTGACTGQRPQLRRILALMAAHSIVRNTDVRAEHATGASMVATGVDRGSRQPAIVHNFLRTEEWCVAHGRRAQVELFGVARAASLALAPPALHHFAADTLTGDVLSAAAGLHVWACPPFVSAIVGRLLQAGIALLERAPNTIITVVIPVWQERWWWRKYVDTVYSVLRVYPHGTDVFERVGTLERSGAHGVRLGNLPFDVAVLRLEAPGTFA